MHATTLHPPDAKAAARAPQASARHDLESTRTDRDAKAEQLAGREAEAAVLARDLEAVEPTLQGLRACLRQADARVEALEARAEAGEAHALKLQRELSEAMAYGAGLKVGALVGAPGRCRTHYSHDYPWSSAVWHGWALPGGLARGERCALHWRRGLAGVRFHRLLTLAALLACCAACCAAALRHGGRPSWTPPSAASPSSPTQSPPPTRRCVACPGRIDGPFQGWACP